MQPVVPVSTRLVALLAGLTTAFGCGSGGSGTDADADDQTPDAGDDNGAGVNAYVTDLPPWEQPPPDEDVETVLKSVTRDKATANGPVRFSCARTQHDVLKSHTSILALGSSQSALKPGLLLQGTPYRSGTLQSLPIARSPVTLSIDLAVPTPTVTVEDPTTASLQQAVSTLQIAASSELTDLPALVAYSRKETTSQEQMSLQLGVAASYSSELSSVNFEAAFANQESEERYTVVAQLMQPMYTIAFADDAIAEPSQFFAPTVTADDLLAQEALGTIGPDNLPVFVSSVTYGRLVVFTATSTQASSASQISAALDASVSAYQFGTTLDVEIQSFLSSLEVEVLAIGGNAATVSSAIVSGDYSALFDSADATSAVPLKFAVKNLAGARPPAGIGDALQFVEENCTPITALGWAEAVPDVGPAVFKQVSVGKGGHVWAVANNDGDVYRFDDATGTMVLVDDGLNVQEMAVDDDGTAYGLMSTQKVKPHNVGAAGFGTVAALEAQNFVHVDVAGGRMFGMKTDSQFSTYTAATGWQNIAPNMATGYAVSSADGAHAWFRGGNLGAASASSYTINSAGGIALKSTMPAVMPAAASAAEVWGLDTTFAVRKYNFGTSAWDASPLPAPEVSIVALDAGPNDNVWVITGDGRLLHWVE